MTGTVFCDNLPVNDIQGQPAEDIEKRRGLNGQKPGRETERTAGNRFYRIPKKIDSIDEEKKAEMALMHRAKADVIRFADAIDTDRIEHGELLMASEMILCDKPLGNEVIGKIRAIERVLGISDGEMAASIETVFDYRGGIFHSIDDICSEESLRESPDSRRAEYCIAYARVSVNTIKELLKRIRADELNPYADLIFSSIIRREKRIETKIRKEQAEFDVQEICCGIGLTGPETSEGDLILFGCGTDAGDRELTPEEIIRVDEIGKCLGVGGKLIRSVTKRRLAERGDIVTVSKKELKELIRARLYDLE